MAEETVNPAKKKKTYNVVSNKDLIAKGDRGKVVIAARGASSVGKENKFADTKLSKFKTSSAILNRIGQKGGALWSADEKVFSPVLAAAKAANTDLTERKYTGAVRDFINKFYELAPRGTGGGGVRITPKLW